MSMAEIIEIVLGILSIIISTFVSILITVFINISDNASQKNMKEILFAISELMRQINNNIIKIIKSSDCTFDKETNSKNNEGNAFTECKGWMNHYRCKCEK